MTPYIGIDRRLPARRQLSALARSCDDAKWERCRKSDLLDALTQCAALLLPAMTTARGESKKQIERVATAIVEAVAAIKEAA